MPIMRMSAISEMAAAKAPLPLRMRGLHFATVEGGALGTNLKKPRILVLSHTRLKSYQVSRIWFKTHAFWLPSNPLMQLPVNLTHN